MTDRAGGHGVGGRRRPGPALTRRRVFAAGLAPLLLAGCSTAGSGSGAGEAGAGSGTPGARGTVTWLVRGVQSENDWQQSVAVPRMRELHPQVTIDLQIAPTGTAWDEKVFAMHAGGTPPDVHNGIVGTFIQLYAQDKLLELTPLVARDKVDLKPYGGFERDPDMCRGGKQWALPVLSGLSILTFVNVSLLEQGGIPLPPTSWQDRTWTWDRLVDTALRATQRTGEPDAVYGLLPGNLAGNFAHAMPYLWGGDPYPREFYAQGIAQESAWTAPAVVEALQAYQDLALRHRVSPRRGAPSKPWIQGGGALWCSLGWDIFAQLRTMDSFKWAIAPLPWKTTNRAITFVDCALVSKAAQAPDAAWQLLKYLTGKEGQADYTQATGAPPVRLDALDPWIDATLKLPGASFKGREQLNEVVTGFLRDHVDNWAHYTVDAGRFQALQRETDARLLGGELAAQPALAALKTQADAQLRETYERFKATRLVRDTLCR